MSNGVSPVEAWQLVGRGEARILDLRTDVERRATARRRARSPVSLARHALRPEGPGAMYLCQHAVRSKLTLRRGAFEVAGGFAAWHERGLPVERAPGRR